MGVGYIRFRFGREFGSFPCRLVGMGSRRPAAKRRVRGRGAQNSRPAGLFPAAAGHEPGQGEEAKCAGGGFRDLLYQGSRYDSDGFHAALPLDSFMDLLEVPLNKTLV